MWPILQLPSCYSVFGRDNGGLALTSAAVLSRPAAVLRSLISDRGLYSIDVALARFACKWLHARRDRRTC